MHGFRGRYQLDSPWEASFRHFASASRRSHQYVEPRPLAVDLASGALGLVAHMSMDRACWAHLSAVSFTLDARMAGYPVERCPVSLHDSVQANLMRPEVGRERTKSRKCCQCIARSAWPVASAQWPVERLSELLSPRHQKRENRGIWAHSPYRLAVPLHRSYSRILRCADLSDTSLKMTKSVGGTTTTSF